MCSNNRWNFPDSLHSYLDTPFIAVGNSGFVLRNKVINTCPGSVADLWSIAKPINFMFPAPQYFYMYQVYKSTNCGYKILWHDFAKMIDWFCSLFYYVNAAPLGLWICSSWPLMELVAPDSVNGLLMQLCLYGTHIVCASGPIKKEPDQLLPVQSRDSAQSGLSGNQQHWSISGKHASRRAPLLRSVSFLHDAHKSLAGTAWETRRPT